MADEYTHLENETSSRQEFTPSAWITNVALPYSISDGTSTNDLLLSDGRVEQIFSPGKKPDENFDRVYDGNGGLIAPSLCHPHVHIDKAYLLSHPKYSHLQVQKGNFQEAMTLTGRAKALFDNEDLLERGQRVIDESSAAGVTHMRAFVEVDAGVRTKCLGAGIALKQKSSADKTCIVQLCAFAQLPLFSCAPKDPEGEIIRNLMYEAAGIDEVDVIGSTPYVESDREKMEKNVDWMVDLSIQHNLHLDFHLDYSLDPETQSMVWYVIKALKDKHWGDRTDKRTIVLGHCTRLKLFNLSEWRNLAYAIDEAGLPISFVGLPTSDLYMMRTVPEAEDDLTPEIRGTLDVLWMIKDMKLNACLGINNIGNAFTPQGSCDPLNLACQGVGIYQAGTVEDARLLYSCMSTRAKAAIGFTSLDDRKYLDIESLDGQPADLILFRGETDPQRQWQTAKTISEVVYLHDNCRGRRTFLNGNLTEIPH